MGHFYGSGIHGFVTRPPILDILLLTVLVMTQVLLSVGGNIIWREPPPFQTISEASRISTTTKRVIRGSLNEKLSCNFSLTADLRIRIVSMKVRGQPAVTFVPNVLLRVEPFFAKRFNAVWVPNKLTLILFNVTYAEEGEYCCEVVTIGSSARSWIRKIQLLVVDRIQTTVSPVTASEDPRRTMASSISGSQNPSQAMVSPITVSQSLIRTTEPSFAASEGDVPWGIIGAVVGVAIATTIAIVMVCSLKQRKRVEMHIEVLLGERQVKDNEEMVLSQVQIGYAQSGPPAASGPKGQPFCDE